MIISYGKIGVRGADRFTWAEQHSRVGLPNHCDVVEAVTYGGHVEIHGAERADSLFLALLLPKTIVDNSALFVRFPAAPRDAVG